MKFESDRREFLKTAGRWLLLGGLVAAGIKTVSGNREHAYECESNGICKGCQRLNICENPNAVSLKQSQK